MIFADLFFVYLFLPLNIIVYYISGNRAYRNAVLVLFSLFFYAWGEPVMVLLMLFTACLNCLLSVVIEDARTQGVRKAALMAAVAVSLGLFVFFKYSGFLVANLNMLSGLAIPAPKVSLPIGISFYTFQALSYTLDVYRGTVKAQRSVGKFLMYISLYTQLVAGPIVRYSDIEGEIDGRRENYGDISAGLSRFCVGLAKKVLVANIAGSVASRLLDGDLAALTTLGGWLAILLFALQIYYDFSGYSDMAIGLGRVFGFHFPENFIYPYAARSVTEFWRRWHISLGTFFRDYLYIPLGGNRRHWARNLAVTWIATGLWHGASWNFVLWGAYFGLLIFLERLFLTDLLAKLPRVFSHLYLIAAVLIGWVLFYYTDMHRALAFFGVLFGMSGGGLYDTETLVLAANRIWWLLASLVFCTPVLPALGRRFRQYGDGLPERLLLDVGRPAFNVLLLAACTALLVGQSYNPFLYYRF